SFPDDLGSQVYALGVGGDDYLPLYRDGDIIVIAPGIPIRRGDRIVLRQTTGGMLVGSFVIGILIGPDGFGPISPLFQAGLTGVL
ncbi:MAG: S24 family peptidase, partial [Pannonibacter indicus]